MASIFKRPNSARWWCQFYEKAGEGEYRKIRLSTGTTNKKAALAIAAKMEADHKGTVAAGSDEVRRLRALVEDTLRKAEVGKFNLATARKFMGDMLTATTGETLEVFTVRKWTEEWLRRKKQVTASATLARYKHSTGKFIDWLGERADTPLENTTAAMVREWRDGMRAKGRAAKTCNMALKDVGAIFRAAVREGLLLANPAAAVDLLPEEDSLEREPFTPEEVAALVAGATSADWRGMVLLGAFAGMRIGDAAALTWADVDMVKGMITFTPKKTARKKRSLELPMHPALVEFFEGHPSADTAAAPVFPSLAGREVGGKSGLSAEFITIMGSCGVERGERREAPVGDDVGKRTRATGKATAAKSFHSLRHTFVSSLANADIPEEIRMKLSGHTTRAAHQIYTKTETDTLRKAVEKLPTIQKP